MRIALTGCSGFIGSVLARHLTDSGHTVTGLVRETSRRDHLEGVVDRFVTGSQADEAAWGPLLEDADALVHNSLDWRPLKSGDLDEHLQSNLVACLRLLRAAAPRKVVFVSTIAVHYDMRPRFAGVIDEDHPTRPNTLYGAVKASVEAHLWAEHFSREQPFAAVRPCAVYGIDPNLSRSIGHPIVERLRTKGRFSRAGGGKFVHVQDVAATIRVLLERDDITSGVFNLVDCYARWGDWGEMAADILGIEADIDTSSPSVPANQFDVSATRALGVSLDRGHAGIRQHLQELITQMAE